jgi:hypothetical protein
MLQQGLLYHAIVAGAIFRENITLVTALARIPMPKARLSCDLQLTLRLLIAPRRGAARIRAYR